MCCLPWPVVDNVLFTLARSRSCVVYLVVNQANTQLTKSKELKSLLDLYIYIPYSSIKSGENRTKRNQTNLYGVF